MTPLAEQLRPKTLNEFVGQEHLVGKDGPIRKMLESKEIKSMIFWGPPGSGKTTLARLVPQYTDARFVPFSAVTGGIADVRKVVEEAKRSLFGSKGTVLFVDEIHRFNKAQQDAFLPHVEDGTIILIGATTENPGFEVNAPLISRSQVYVFNALSDDETKEIILRAAKLFKDRKWSKEAVDFMVTYANGDARAAIKAVELSLTGGKKIGLKEVENALQKRQVYYDKKGDSHYDTISAFIKSMRGSQPDATLHYLARMIKAGEDPVFIARRMLIFASEDIGNAQPAALMLTTSCMQAVKMIGMPESQLILAQTATYLASAKKSIASTVGIGEALFDVERMKLESIPLHLRNAANKVMKNLDYGKGHVRYPWLTQKETGENVDQEYMPKNLKGKNYYRKDWE